MLKSELREKLYKGVTLKSLFDFSVGQGCDIYKNHWPKEGEDKNQIIYVTTFDFCDEKIYEPIPFIEIIEENVMPRVFTVWDFIDICNGNEKLAEYLFAYVDWQTPSMALECDFREFDDDEFAEICGFTYEQLFG